MLRSIALVGLLLAGCSTASAPPDEPPPAACPAPTCGANFRVTGWWIASEDRVSGWNVHVSGTADLRAIADGLADSQDGRRFVLFYGQPVYGFTLPPNSIDDPRHALAADPSFVALYDYRDDEPFIVVEGP